MRQKNVLPSPKERVPMTGFLGSVLTSATGLYTQLIPTSPISNPEALVTSSASSVEPVAAIHMAPGLYA